MNATHKQCSFSYVNIKMCYHIYQNEAKTCKSNPHSKVIEVNKYSGADLPLGESHRCMKYKKAKLNQTMSLLTS